MELRGIDPLAFRMQSGRSTTELQPLILRRRSIARSVIFSESFVFESTHEFIYLVVSSNNLRSYLTDKHRI